MREKIAVAIRDSYPERKDARLKLADVLRVADAVRRQDYDIVPVLSDFNP